MPNKIIAVEDDPAILAVVSEYLKDAGFDVRGCADGAEAKERIARGEQADLFILDIMLPGVSGLELLKYIRQQRGEGAAVIMLTALNDEYTQLLSFEGLADDYISKPFSPKILVKRVQALLRRTGEPGETLRFGDITMDTDGYQAYENGERLDLTLKEFEILKTLLVNRRRVLSRQQLLNLVWGYDYFGDERLVDVHIKNLRKKLSANIIVTVKNVGYKAEQQEA